MRRLIGIVATGFCLLFVVGCDGPPERREFAPEDQVGPSVDEVETSSRAVIVLEQECTFRAMPQTSCTSTVSFASDKERGEVEMTQRIRSKMGWGCADASTPSLWKASNNHATYFRVHQFDSCANDGHTETPGCSLFTGHSWVERINAAGGYPSLSFQGTGTEALTASLPAESPELSVCGLFLDAPYHHQAFIVKGRKWVGAGFNEDRGVVGFGAYVINWADGPETPPTPSAPLVDAAFWPRPGSGNNRRTTDASHEQPAPPNCAGGWPNCGGLASFRAPGFFVSGTALCKKESNGTCTHVPHVALVGATDPNVAWDTGLLYAHAKLQASTVYRVQFFGQFLSGGHWYDAAPWWEFSTGPGEL